MDPYTVRPAHISGVRTRAQGEELSVFNTVTAEFFVLNRTGRFVWASCDGRTTLAEIAERLHQACVTPPGLDAVLDDVCSLAETMRDRGLIELKL